MKKTFTILLLFISILSFSQSDFEDDLLDSDGLYSSESGIINYSVIESGFTIIPKQVDSRMKVHFNRAVNNGRIQIYNSADQLINNYILGNGIDVFNMDVSNLSTGQYYVKYVYIGGVEIESFMKM